jgi:hypothetical protein
MHSASNAAATSQSMVLLTATAAIDRCVTVDTTTAWQQAHLVHALSDPQYVIYATVCLLLCCCVCCLQALTPVQPAQTLFVELLSAALLSTNTSKQYSVGAKLH